MRDVQDHRGGWFPAPELQGGRSRRKHSAHRRKHSAHRRSLRGGWIGYMPGGRPAPKPQGGRSRRKHHRKRSAHRRSLRGGWRIAPVKWA
jgi:hypothetical protein